MHVAYSLIFPILSILAKAQQRSCFHEFHLTMTYSYTAQICLHISLEHCINMTAYNYELCNKGKHARKRE